MNELISSFECETSYDHVGRVYHIDEKRRYHSVTTMLGNSGDKDFLKDWRERISDEEADRITRVAAQLGTDFHQLGEDYFLKKEPSKVQWMATHLFNKAKVILDRRVTKVHAVECVLLSHLMRLAGRTDAIVDWDNQLAIFDYKCIGHHNHEWLEEYWIQLEIYKQMAKEMYGLDIKKLVLVCANKKNLKVKSFEMSPLKYSKQAVGRIKIFRERIKKDLHHS